MSLKYWAKTKDEIPPEHQPLYVERDGVWMLDVDGALDKSDFPEFRPTGATLLNQLRNSHLLCSAQLPASPLATSITSAGTRDCSRLSV